MTNEEAIKDIKENIKPFVGGKSLDMAIKALRVVGRIKEIINISNFVIQEDVLKYKMICEVVEKMSGGEDE